MAMLWKEIKHILEAEDAVKAGTPHTSLNPFILKRLTIWP